MNPERSDGDPLDEAIEAAGELAVEANQAAEQVADSATEAMAAAGEALAEARAYASAGGKREAGVLDEARDWAEAVVLGVGDTFKDMLRAGRRGAREAQSEHWARFDAKTRFRRKGPPTA